MKEYKIGFGTEFDKDQSCIPVAELKRALDRIKHNAMIGFGGFTLIDCDGGWVNDNNVHVLEKGKQISLIYHAAKNVRDFAAYVCVKLNQESVVLILPDGTVEFISVEPSDQWSGCDIGESKPIYDGHG